MKIGDFDIPDDLKYSEKHQWAKVEGDNIRVGITDFAKKQLKEIVYVGFNVGVGDTVDAAGDEPIAEIESTKAVGEVFAPVSGEVIEINEALEDDPDPNLSDAYGNGWMFVIKPSNKDIDLGNLLDAAAYAEIVKKEA
ncbi:MAG: glycine cleavage system protein GcvH [Candidatus Helarchaeota archaeon]